MPRHYTSIRRAVQLAETRQRIIDATFALHAERGVLGTKPGEIAARANVALTTYYKHFPTPSDIVRACGARGQEITPPPDPATITVLPPDPALRIQAMVRTLFNHYEKREPWLYVGRTEERYFPEIQLAMKHMGEWRDAFVQGALVPAPATREATAIATALVDYWAWRTLRREIGLTQEEVIQTVTKTLTQVVIAPVPDEGPRPARPGG